MIAELTTILPKHKLIICNAENIYVVDYKNINGGGVEILNTEPIDAKYVHLKNENTIEVVFDAFDENALPLDEPGANNRQCECLVFPYNYTSKSWILFIETKYSNDIVSAFKDEYNYPNCMVSQILESVNYFRNKGIIEQNRRVNAIVSFPNLIEEFNSTFFENTEEDHMDILLNHKVLIRATNKANIISQKRIRLIVE